MARRVILDYQHQLLIALAVMVLVGISLWPMLHFYHWLIVCWNSFSLTTLALAWWHIITGSPTQVRREAWLQDAGKTFIFVLVILCACASLAAIWQLMADSKRHMPTGSGPHVVLSIFSILTAWSLVHTIFALRYAHIYYGDWDAEVGADKGLAFPGGGSLITWILRTTRLS